MRTTVTLDDDTMALVQRHMRERGLSFKEALNQAIRRAGLTSPKAAAPFRTPTARMGQPVINLDRALRIAGELADEELVRKQRVGK